MKALALMTLGALTAVLGAVDATGTVKRVRFDVPYVPTPQAVVDKMLEMAKVGPKDYVVDLGSGDGRIVLTAVKEHGAKGMGVDLDPDHIASSRAAAKAAGISDRAQFVNADLFQTDISKATVLTMYLLPSVNIKLRPRILSELEPGTRVVSHAFDMEDWEPDARETVEGSTIYYWVVPAKVEGAWSLSLGAGKETVPVTLNQTFQEISGTAKVNGQDVPLTDAKLDGAEIAFTLVRGNGGKNTAQRFEGTVDGDRMVGTASPEGSKRSQKWRASRK